jgi:hypothetical protein
MLISILLPLLFILPAGAIGKPATPATDSTRTMDEYKTGKTGKVVGSSVHDLGVPYKSGNRRDPFLAPPIPKSSVKTDEETSRGLPPPGIAGTYVAQVVLEGISVRNDRKMAIVRSKDNRAYFLREGARLFDGYLKTIQEDSITLVRETFMKSGKELTHEVTKRLRTP